MSKFSKDGMARLENKRLIQRYIDQTGLYQAEFAASIGVKPQNLSQVLNGQSHSRKILDGLRGIGVPEDLLCDPRREEPEHAPSGVKKLSLAGKPENPQLGLKISYRAMAKACGVSAATISQIMKHGKYPKIGAAELRQRIIALVVTHGIVLENAERQIPQTDEAV